jgi:hypothetical protein
MDPVTFTSYDGLRLLASNTVPKRWWKRKTVSMVDGVEWNGSAPDAYGVNDKLEIGGILI